MRFFRGIAVTTQKVDETIVAIAERGLTEGQGRWQMVCQHPGSIDPLFAKPDLSLEDTRSNRTPEYPAVCACGEAAGAAHYAWRHNRSQENDTPIMVEFDAGLDAVAVDGRDFLYSVFQRGDPERARGFLERGFGKRALRYAEKAWTSDNQQFRIALCDLAIHDPDVVQAHHASTLVIAGRYRTVFRSAFIVKLRALRYRGVCSFAV